MHFVWKSLITYSLPITRCHRAHLLVESCLDSWVLMITKICILFGAEYVCPVAASCFASTANAGYGRSWDGRGLWWPSSTHGRGYGHASNAAIWYATNGFLLRRVWMRFHGWRFTVISELFESVCLRCPLLKTDGQKRLGLLRVGVAK